MEFTLTERSKNQFKEMIRDVIKEELGLHEGKNEKDEIPYELISLEEACKLIGCSKTTLYHYRKKGLIPYSQIGRKIRFNKSDLFRVNHIDRRFR